MGLQPVVIAARPSFATWVDWAKHFYALGAMSFGEFDVYVDRMLALGDPAWEPLPGGVHTPERPLKIQHSYGMRDYTFELTVELRAGELGFRQRRSQFPPVRMETVRE